MTGHSTALGQYGNVAANQYMNAVTDPNGNGWKDAYGDGIAFKCDGIFIPAGTYEQFSDGSLWTVRMKWSNAAYLAGTGALNHKSLPGCVLLTGSDWGQPIGLIQSLLMRAKRAKRAERTERGIRGPREASASVGGADSARPRRSFA